MLMNVFGCLGDCLNSIYDKKQIRKGLKELHFIGIKNKNVYFIQTYYILKRSVRKCH